MKSTHKLKFLIVAQTPPPFHGQAIAQKFLVDAQWHWCTKYHIRLSLSKHIKDVSKFNFSKIISIIIVDIKIIYYKFFHKVNILYYPPAGNKKIAFYRDIMIISVVRFLRFKILFHFHSGGLADLFQRLNYIEKKLFQWLYFHPVATISLLPTLVNEVRFLNAEYNFSIPAGVPDNYDVKFTFDNNKNGIKKILFLSNLIETKGVFECLKAAKILRDWGLSIELNFVGEWVETSFQSKMLNFVSDNRLEKLVNFLGFKNGADKYKILLNSDIFCYPTYYALENQPAVILEAMMFELPIITTNWRAIPDIVTDGEEGFLVPIKSPETVAEKIKILVKNSSLRAQMGKKGREKYLKEFTLEKHLSRMEAAFKEVLKSEK